MISGDITVLLDHPPPLSLFVTILLDPPPPRLVTYFLNGPQSIWSQTFDVYDKNLITSYYQKRFHIKTFKTSHFLFKEFYGKVTWQLFSATRAIEIVLKVCLWTLWSFFSFQRDKNLNIFLNGNFDPYMKKSIIDLYQNLTS